MVLSENNFVRETFVVCVCVCFVHIYVFDEMSNLYCYTHFT